MKYPPPSRPVAMGVNGMVSSAHPLASMAGLRVLVEGGNAFDAAVATAVTLGVVEPYMSGPGGIGVALAYIAGEGRVRALNFSGRAPKSAEPPRFTNETKEFGILASLVPGNVAGWLTLHETYGSMERERLFRPAIEYAENGFPITFQATGVIAQTAHLLCPFPASVSFILGGNGQVPAPGSRLKMPQLARSLRQIASGGQDTFYRGELAQSIVAANRELGGLFADEDLAGYQAEWQEPIRIDYRGYRVFTTPPNCSSFQVLQTLKLLECLGAPGSAYHHAGSLHLFMEAVKLCVTDRVKYAGDPEHTQAPIQRLVSAEYAAMQRQRIDSERASVVSGERYARERPAGALSPGSPEEFDGGMTTHFAVADRDGNVATVTQTLGGGFGSGAVMGDTGIFMNNMAHFFDLEEESPNVIGPGKRVDFVVAPTLTFRDDSFFLSMGTPGSWGILQTTPQLVVNILDLGMNIQQAIESPRFRYYTGRQVEMEERFPVQIRRGLEARGHEVSVIEAWSRRVGGAQGIVVDHDQGVFQGGADPRRDGYAIGW